MQLIGGIGGLVFRVAFETRNPKPETLLICHLAEETSTKMREDKELLQFPIQDVEYQPDPGSLAGFIAGMSERVDALLAAANWRPNFE